MKFNKLPKLIPYRKGRYWGFCNKSKELIIDCNYKKVYLYVEGFARVLLKNKEKWNFIDDGGNKITKYDYSSLQDFREDMAVVCRNDEWGFINCLGIEIIPCIYANASSFNEGLAAVKTTENYKWGVIDQSQNIIIDFEYNEICEFKNGIALVRIKDKWGIVNNFGIVVSQCIYENIGRFVNNLAIVKRMIDNEWHEGVIDINGIEVVLCQKYYLKFDNFISCKHDEIIYKYNNSFSCYCLFDKRKYKTSYLDSFKILETQDYLQYLFAEDDLNQLPISKYYNKIIPSCENIAITCFNGKYGLLHKNGGEIVPTIYLELNKFSEEYFIGMNDQGLFGLIDKKGTVQLPHKFTYISKFSKDLFIVSTTEGEYNSYRYYDEKKPCWLVKKDGKVANNKKYNLIGNLSEEYNQLAVVTRNDKYGLINQNGEEVIKCQFSALFNTIGSNLILVMKDNQFGIVNNKGKEIIKCIYSDIFLNFEHSLFYAKKRIDINENDCLTADGYVDFDGNEYWEGTSSDWLYENE